MIWYDMIYLLTAVG